MREVNLHGVDLNLLPALDALLKRRNVTQAATDAGLSQPAMSRALARLRDLLGDPLLVRIPGGGYALTPRAEAIASQLAISLDHLKQVFQEPGFDPSTVERTVRLVGADTHAILLAPALMKRLALEAPGIDVRIEGYRADIIQRMELGSLDMVFAVTGAPLPPGALSMPLARDRLALVLRQGHPMANQEWTLADYGKVSHVGVSIFGDSQSELDAELATAGIERRIALVTPHFLGALASVSATDMATTLSSVFARRFADSLGLLVKRPPVAKVDLELTLVWNRVRDADPVLAWLRGIIRDVARQTMEIGEA